MKSIDFIKRVFSDYYKENYSINGSISMISKREFGFALFDGWMLRHKSFRCESDLRRFLQETVPSHAYCSCAYYEDPEAEMEEKGWLGADLVFDIDADHIPTSCGKVHDVWVCVDCGFSGRGVTPEKCPACGGERFKVKTWPCEVCLDSAKTETVKLLDMLMQDFGFSKSEVHVFFSGHRGYHVQVESEAVRTLDAFARKEIVDYVCGLGIDVTFHGFDKRSWEAGYHESSLHSNTGWRGRILRGLYNFIVRVDEDELYSLGLRKNVVRKILENKKVILQNLNSPRFLRSVKGVGSESWRKILEYCAKLQSAKIDTVVTTDIHRLIRLVNTLHGKTGFKKVEFPVSTIESFDPFKEAVAFKKGTATVFVSDAPKFRIGDEEFGPYKNSKVELPTAAAVLLICKGRGELVE